MADGWRWDPSLYSGAAPHYRRGRLPYPTELAGAVVHVGATTHRGVDDPGELPGPIPPWARIDELVATYLGTRRRAGQGTRPWLTDTPPKPRPEDLALAGAGLVGPHRVPVGGGEVVARPAEEIVDAVHSLSYAAPHLFGDRLAAFDADLRTLLGPGPLFERRREIELSFWRKG